MGPSSLTKIPIRFSPEKRIGTLASEDIGVKASAHSFKQFTSRLLKLSFSLSMHIYNSDGRHA